MNIAKLNTASHDDKTFIIKRGTSGGGGTPDTPSGGGDYFAIIPNPDMTTEGFDMNVAAAAGAFANFPHTGQIIPILELSTENGWKTAICSTDIYESYDKSKQYIGSIIKVGATLQIGEEIATLNGINDVYAVFVSTGVSENAVKASIVECSINDILSNL
jgi:hypothetical protein